ncbi:MAG: histidinol-phosphate aminotransferase [Myxococcales bacterium]
MTSFRMENVPAAHLDLDAGSPLPSRYVAGIRPYDAVSSRDKIDSGCVRDVYKLDWNESTIPPSPMVLAAIGRFLSNTHHLNWYPELYSKRLTTALASYVGVPEGSLLVTNGSDDALDLVCRTYLDDGDEVVVPSPTYTHFLVYAGARGAQILRVYAEDPFHQNLDGILKSVGYRTKLIYLVSPNNPTGIRYSEEQVSRVLEAAPGAIVIVDEAYFEFCGVSVAVLTQRYPNLVVTRTFSKSFGIAGLRIGYAVACPEVIETLKRIFNPKSVNVLGQIAAEAALQDREYLDRYVASVTAAKELIREHLDARGVECRVTPANYVLIRVPDAKRFCALLEDEGVFIRDRSSIPQLQHYARMSVGTVEQTGEILRRVDRVLDRMPYVVRLP